MKKLSKLMALLLSLLMIVSLFTACGEEKKENNDEKKEKTSETADKKEDKLTGKELLIGDWKAEFEIESYTLYLMFNFKEDGTFQTYFTKEFYNKYIDTVVEMNTTGITELTDEEIIEHGYASREEFIEAIRESYAQEFPYEDIEAEFSFSGTWELDSDTLTIITINETGEENEPKFIETKLSNGVESFEFSDDEGTIKFTKAE